MCSTPRIVNQGKNQQGSEDRAARLKLPRTAEGAEISMSKKPRKLLREPSLCLDALDGFNGFNPPSTQAGLSLGRSSREMFLLLCFVGNHPVPSSP